VTGVSESVVSASRKDCSGCIGRGSRRLFSISVYQVVDTLLDHCRNAHARTVADAGRSRGRLFRKAAASGEAKRTLGGTLRV
jgi:hypothetical protein